MCPDDLITLWDAEDSFFTDWEPVCPRCGSRAVMRNRGHVRGVPYFGAKCQECFRQHERPTADELKQVWQQLDPCDPVERHLQRLHPPAEPPAQLDLLGGTPLRELLLNCRRALQQEERWSLGATHTDDARFVLTVPVRDLLLEHLTHALQNLEGDQT